MKLKMYIEAPEITLGTFHIITTPYGEIKYRKQGKKYFLYIDGKKRKEFSTNKKVDKFIKEFITRRFLETHRKGLENE